MIDLGVPRNFDPKINRIDSIFLHDIDALTQIVDRNLAKRRAEIPKAEAIIEEETKKYLAWKNGLQITPTIVTLRQKFEDIRQTELQKHRAKCSASEYQKIDEVTRSILNKLLHEPTVQLKKYGDGHPDSFRCVEMVQNLFGLEK